MERVNCFSLKKQDWEIDPHKIIIKSFLARGGYGLVHKALYDGRLVAIKVLDWGKDECSEKKVLELRESFLNEVDVWRKLDHPNVLKFIGASMGTPSFSFQSHSGNLEFKLPENVCCIASEYQAAGTLKSFIEKRHYAKLDFQTAIRFSIDLAKGLSYLHSKKVVHRDIKTDNVLLDLKLRLKITDFGIAKEDPNENGIKEFHGSYGYMAPEVFYNKLYTSKCDVYSFGICLWEIYCGNVPYENVPFEKLKSDRVYKKLMLKIPRCCPKSLKNVMKRCLEMEPEKRPTMEEVVTMLEAIDTSTGRGMTPMTTSLGCFRWKL